MSKKRWFAMSRILGLGLAAGVAGLLVAHTVGCGAAEDELATLDVLVCQEDAQCVDGVCLVGEEEVETVRVLARAVESIEASRFGENGLFVLATWERDDRWIELEFDVPTDWVGYVDLSIRYAEYVDGESVFTGEDIRGRIVLVLSEGGDTPAAAHIELRVDNGDGEFRRLHQGYLDPDHNDEIHDPGPPDTEIDWDHEGVELLIVDSEPGTGYVRPDNTRTYTYDYSLAAEILDVAVEGCAASCATEAYSDDYEGGTVYYDEEDEGGCNSSDEGKSSCEGDDDYDPYYDDYYDDYESEESCTCQGDSDDDVWDDDSEAQSCDMSCSSDYDDSYDDTGEGCDSSSDTSSDTGGSCDSSSSDTSSSDCSFCEGDTYMTVGAEHRQGLLARARGHRPRPTAGERRVRRALALLPIAFAFAGMRLMRRGRRGGGE